MTAASLMIFFHRGRGEIAVSYGSQFRASSLAALYGLGEMGLLVVARRRRKKS
jgi:hypothetical protein